MSASYNQINYSLRPKKHIERKMLTEAFQRLSVFGKVNGYRYVGFGSLYFTDFILFHRQLGINDMLSIEQDIGNKTRIEFNRPFKCVTLDFRPSSEALPTLNWNKKTILWLDYDGRLNKDSLSDVSTFFTQAPPGSIFLISINAEFRVNAENAFEEFTQLVGQENLPLGVTLKSLAGKGYSKTLHEIINNKIATTLSHRNGALLPKDKIKYDQLFNFSYSDGVKMLTIGGVIYKNSQNQKVSASLWEDLDYIRTGVDSYEIDAPCLTSKEIRHLEAHYPVGARPRRRTLEIPIDVEERYAKVYRYYPLYSATEI